MARPLRTCNVGGWRRFALGEDCTKQAIQTAGLLIDDYLVEIPATMGRAHHGNNPYDGNYD
jgi:hypothetical protein